MPVDFVYFENEEVDEEEDPRDEVYIKAIDIACKQGKTYATAPTELELFSLVKSDFVKYYTEVEANDLTHQPYRRQMN